MPAKFTGSTNKVLRAGRAVTLLGRWCLWFTLAAGLLGPESLRAQQFSESVLHSFAPPPKGANPDAGVVADASGNLYGTAYSGGAMNQGVVYKVSASGASVLHSFAGGADGAYPYSGVTLDLAGNLYGTTFSGGIKNAGVIYKIDTSGEETILHTSVAVSMEVSLLTDWPSMGLETFTEQRL